MLRHTLPEAASSTFACVSTPFPGSGGCGEGTFSLSYSEAAGVVVRRTVPVSSACVPATLVLLNNGLKARG